MGEKLKPKLFIILTRIALLLLIGCQPQTIVKYKYQCQNGQVADFLELCSQQECKNNTKLTTKYQCQNGQITDSIGLCSEQKCPTIKYQNISIPYIEKQAYEYNFKYGVVSDKTLGALLELNNWGTAQTTKIKNLDDKAVDFQVMHHYRTLKNEGTREKKLVVNADETKDFVTNFDTALGEDVEVKTEIIALSETRYKEVIKYKQIETCSYSNG